jgi:signal transduction histidine kinase
VVKIRRLSATTIVLSVLLLSLVVSGVLVVGLVDRLSEKELQDRREALESGMLGFRADLAGTLFRAVSESHPGPPSLLFSQDLEEDLAGEFVRSSKRAGESQLVSGLALGLRTESGEIRFRQFDPATRRFVTAPWPEDLTGLRASLQPQKSQERRSAERRPAFAFLLTGERPVIALPLIYREPGSWNLERRPDEQSRRERAGRPEKPPNAGSGSEPADAWMRGRRWPPPESADPGHADPGTQPEPGRLGLWGGWARRIPGFTPEGAGPIPPRGGLQFPPREGAERAGARLVGWRFLILDYQKLKSQVLPQLLARHFRGREREFGLAVISPQGFRFVLKSGAPVDIGLDTRVDAALSLVERRGPVVEPPGTPGVRPFQIEIAQSVPLRNVLKSQPTGWILAARHQSGSLESLVGHNRSRSIALVLTLLGLLGGSGTLLVLSSRKSKELAKRQMEFVAGVSHELLTPLSVIRAAASNLSRGLISDKEKALEYGKTLEKESKRLSKMIEQVLSFAALQSGGGRAGCEPIDVSELLREIVSEYRPALEQKGWEVQEEIEPVGRARIDRRTLESCLYNLIDNAAKYANSGRWLRVTASRDARKSKPLVRINVEDRGPGIAAEDLHHIFKPFYRGRGLAASPVPGAGLGLSIVRRHLRKLGGDASVASSAHGCAFSLVLPAID